MTAQQSKNSTFELQLRRRWLIAILIGGLGLYLGLALTAWQVFVPFAWLRIGVAWLLLLTPGLLLQQLLWRDISASQRLAVGFGVSVALGGILGLMATALHLALSFVIGGLTCMTIGCAILLAARTKWQWRHRWQIHFSFTSLLLLAPIVLACLIVVRLTYSVALENDDLSYNAYVTHWLEAARFDWQQLPLAVSKLAPSRFWLAYWTLNQAVLAKWSALNGMELTRLYLAPSLALLALLGTYALARAFDMTRNVSAFAVTMQTVALLLLSNVDQAGLVFFNRLVEDKVAAAFTLIPLFAIVVTAFLKQRTRGRFALLVLVGAALVLTHPTLMAVAVAATTLYTIFSTIPTRDWRGLGAVMFVLFLMLSAPMGMRLFDSSYTDKIPFAVETLERTDQLRRVMEIGSVLYAIHPNLYFSLPFLWTLVSALVGIVEWKTSYAARWILAATVIVVSVINPLTTWLWGFAIGSSQIWRTLWFTPFGIAAAYLLLFLWRRVFRARWASVLTTRAAVLLAIFSLLLLSGTLFLLLRSPQSRRMHSFQKPAHARETDYGRLLAFKSALDTQLTEPTVVVGGTRWINDRLPLLSANAQVFSFRTAPAMWQLSNLEWEDADARTNARRKLQATKTDVDERLAILEKYKVRLIVTEPDILWVHQIVASRPERLQYLGTHNALEMYRVLP